MNQEAVRLNKFLSEKGICSRREADRLTEEGKILVNGQKAVLGMKVMPEDEIWVNGKEVSRKKVKDVLIAVNKPKGVVCTTAEFETEKNIVDLVNYPTRIYPVGRLDKDSEGLILMTNNGDLVNKILKSSNNHEKEYVVVVNKQVTEKFLDGMRSGVPILDTVTKPCSCERSGNREFHITLTQGLNRQIRRMCEYFGYRVEKLKRVRVMNIRLGNLPVGHYRNVTEKELRQMKRMFLEQEQTERRGQV